MPLQGAFFSFSHANVEQPLFDRREVCWSRTSKTRHTCLGWDASLTMLGLVLVMLYHLSLPLSARHWRVTDRQRHNDCCFREMMSPIVATIMNVVSGVMTLSLQRLTNAIQFGTLGGILAKFHWVVRTTYKTTNLTDTIFLAWCLRSGKSETFSVYFSQEWKRVYRDRSTMRLVDCIVFNNMPTVLF